ncbi:MAG: hypothetical protein LBD11_00685 [Candidatus Peribacteria bacterium]|nr:hypothetical protein [Candidatus Peribacteria bacterium]
MVICATILHRDSGKVWNQGFSHFRYRESRPVRFFTDPPAIEEAEIQMFSGNGLLGSAQLFQSVGYDEAIAWIAEDMDFTLSLYEKGAKLFVFPDLIVRHYEREKTFLEGVRIGSQTQAHQKAKNWFLFVWKHGNFWNKVQFRCLGLPGCLVWLSLKALIYGGKKRWSIIHGLFQGARAGWKQVSNPQLFTIPLLLTATITPQTHCELNLTEPNKRYHQYLNNLIRLIKESDFQNFVFCENSASEFPDREMIENLANKLGKQIEFLSFKGDEELIQKYTRAYGDQEIMEYALQHSKILAQHASFYKLTGRYRVANINTLLRVRSKEFTVFIKGGVRIPTVHTSFFKADKEYFKKYLQGKYVDLPNYPHQRLEYLYYDQIKKSGKAMHLHGHYPFFQGERGE